MEQQRTLLVVDDEQAICVAFQRFFQARQWTVRVAPGVTKALALFADVRPDVVFLDVRLADGSGLELLHALRAADPDACVVIITAYGSLDVATQAVQRGAFDVLVKPLDLDKVAQVAESAWHARQMLRTAAAAPPGLEPGNAAGIVGTSPAMQRLYKQIAYIAAAEGAVLVTGETGSGKELVVRAVHEYSRRRDQPFVAVNCGALPENLVESELFGHVRGAFTGAHADRAGRFECADGGTLFLDEIGDLPQPAQVKLLRVLDTGVVERLGSTQSKHFDVRVVAATNRNLDEETRAGRFRADLFYRLAVLRIEVPRLADRSEDIVLLARYFLARRHPPEQTAPGAAGAAWPQTTVLSPEAETALRAYGWPGNVRELKHVVEQAAVLAGGGRILPDHLPGFVRSPTLAGHAPDDFRQLVRDYLARTGGGQQPLYQGIVEAAEAEAIRFALTRCQGNQTEAAVLLGIHRNTLRHRLQALAAYSLPSGA